jgi:hypothetical protein
MYYYQHDGGLQGTQALFSIMTLRYNWLFGHGVYAEASFRCWSNIRINDMI